MYIPCVLTILFLHIYPMEEKPKCTGKLYMNIYGNFKMPRLGRNPYVCSPGKQSGVAN